MNIPLAWVLAAEMVRPPYVPTWLVTKAPNGNRCTVRVDEPINLDTFNHALVQVPVLGESFIQPR